MQGVRWYTRIIMRGQVERVQVFIWEQKTKLLSGSLACL